MERMTRFRSAMLLGIFGFGIISYALMQSELNKYAA